jgi:hypothetical protein
VFSYPYAVVAPKPAGVTPSCGAPNQLTQSALYVTATSSPQGNSSDNVLPDPGTTRALTCLRPNQIPGGNSGFGAQIPGLRQ